MAKLFGLARIGRDAEIRYTNSGDAVCSLSLAFTYGKKGNDGKRPTQWVDAAMWGKRAEALAPYLLKGGLVSVTLDEVHIETYEGKNGTGYKLAAKVIDIELAGGEKSRVSEPVKVTPTEKSNFDDLDEDIPF